MLPWGYGEWFSTRSISVVYFIIKNQSFSFLKNNRRKGSISCYGRHYLIFCVHSVQTSMKYNVFKLNLGSQKRSLLLIYIPIFIEFLERASGYLRWPSITLLASDNFSHFQLFFFLRLDFFLFLLIDEYYVVVFTNIQGKLICLSSRLFDIQVIFIQPGFHQRHNEQVEQA